MTAGNHDQVLADICHKLRTPLGTIIGYAEVLTMPEMQLTEAKRLEFLQDVLQAARRMQAVLDGAQGIQGIQGIRADDAVAGPHGGADAAGAADPTGAPGG